MRNRRNFMKKLFIIFPLLIITFFFPKKIVSANFESCININGYWSKWEQQRGISCQLQYNHIQDKFEGLLFYINNQPWDYMFKIDIDNYYKPNKKERKKHLKDKVWYQYQGWVEYYVIDSYPTILDVLKWTGFPSISPERYKHMAPNVVKRRARATIKIAPYKDLPSTFNILFDNIGVGISFKVWPFDSKISKKLFNE